MPATHSELLLGPSAAGRCTAHTHPGPGSCTHALLPATPLSTAMQGSHRAAGGHQRLPKGHSTHSKATRETQTAVAHLHALLSSLLQPHPGVVTAKRGLASGPSFPTLKWCQDPSEGFPSAPQLRRELRGLFPTYQTERPQQQQP